MFNSFPQPKPDSGGGNIKSVQQGFVTLSATITNIPISVVNLSKAVVTISVKPGATTLTTDAVLVGADITTPTNLQLKVNSTAGALTAYWQVIEYLNVKSLQKGMKNFGASPATIPISPINTEKSVLFFSVATLNNSSSLENAFVSAEITNSTQLTLNQFATVGKDVYWQVVEF